MGTWAGFCPDLHLSLGIWVIIAAHILQNAKAEITCASCPSPVQLYQEDFKLVLRTDAKKETSTLQNIRIELRELGVGDKNAGTDDHHRIGGFTADVPPFVQHGSLDRVSKKKDTTGSSEESHRGSQGDRDIDMNVDAVLPRAKRSGSEFDEFSKSGWTGRTTVDTSAPDVRGSLLDGHRQGKSDFKWNRDDERGNTRQDERKIVSSTFALTGDSAHNHAVVYWSGQNSSVSNTYAYHCYIIISVSTVWSAFHECTSHLNCF